MTMKRSSANLVTVRSHTIPPLSSSTDVYVIRPMGWSIWLAVSRWRAASAPGPVTSSLVIAVRSKIAALSRAVLCSAPTMGDQLRTAQPFRSFQGSS